jgi:hypothetical protein
MATSSFYEMMVIDTPEKAAALNAAYKAAEERGPLDLGHIDFLKELEENEEFLRNNPDWLKRVAAEAKRWHEENGVEIEYPDD